MAARSGFFIPNLCAAQPVFLLVLVAELLALVLCVGAEGLRHFNWGRFAASSLFVQWVALSSAAVLCRLRVALLHWPPARAAAVGYAVVLVITALVGVVAQWLTGPLLGVDPWRFDYWQLLDVLLVGAVLSGIGLRYLYVAQQLRERQGAELTARVEALQARIRPHFLYNSMNTIASLTRSNPLQAEEAVQDLADLFRANLSEKRNLITLKEELEAARIYQRIEQLRLGERLRVRWDVNDLPMRALVPALTVQPLLENAIGHGVENLEDGGEVSVEGGQSEGMVLLRVRNPMPFDNPNARGGHGIALDNIRERLLLLFGTRADVRAGREGDEFVVELRFPATETLPELAS